MAHIARVWPAHLAAIVLFALLNPVWWLPQASSIPYITLANVFLLQLWIPFSTSDFSLYAKFMRAYGLLKNSNEQDLKARCLCSAAHCKFSLKDYPGAENLFRQAADLLLHSPNQSLRIVCLSAAGDCNSEIGDYEAALKLYNWAAQLQTESKVIDFAAGKRYFEKAIVHDRINRISYAIKAEQKAEEIFKQLDPKNIPELASTRSENLFRLAYDHALEGHRQNAITLFNQADAILKQYGLSPTKLSIECAQIIAKKQRS